MNTSTTSTGVPDNERLFALGQNLHGQSRHTEAELVFRLLCIREPLDARFTTAHAAALAASGQHGPAMLVNAMRFATNMSDFSACIAYCESQIELGKRADAEETLRAVLAACPLAQRAPRRRAEALLKLIDATSSTPPSEGPAR